jgi:hypothetical protein
MMPLSGTSRVPLDCPTFAPRQHFGNGEIEAVPRRCDIKESSMNHSVLCIAGSVDIVIRKPQVSLRQGKPG